MKKINNVQDLKMVLKVKDNYISTANTIELESSALGNDVSVFIEIDEGGTLKVFLIENENQNNEGR